MYEKLKYSHENMRVPARFVYEAAHVLGIGRLRRFTAITLPYLRKPLISILFSFLPLSSPIMACR